MSVDASVQIPTAAQARTMVREFRAYDALTTGNTMLRDDVPANIVHAARSGKSMVWICLKDHEPDLDAVCADCRQEGYQVLVRRNTSNNDQLLRIDWSVDEEPPLGPKHAL